MNTCVWHARFGKRSGKGPLSRITPSQPQRRRGQELFCCARNCGRPKGGRKGKKVLDAVGSGGYPAPSNRHRGLAFKCTTTYNPSHVSAEPKQ